MGDVNPATEAGDTRPVQRTFGRPKGSKNRDLGLNPHAQIIPATERSRRPQPENHTYNIKQAFQKLRQDSAAAHAISNKDRKRGRPPGKKSKSTVVENGGIKAARWGKPIGSKTKKHVDEPGMDEDAEKGVVEVTRMDKPTSADDFTPFMDEPKDSFQDYEMFSGNPDPHKIEVVQQAKKGRPMGAKNKATLLRKQNEGLQTYGRVIGEAESTEGDSIRVVRKGRPKGSKNKVKLPREQIEAYQNYRLMIGEAVQVAKKGRPKGSKNKATLLKEQIEGSRNHISTTGVKRKRGRPRKEEINSFIVQRFTPKQSNTQTARPISHRNFGGVMPTLETVSGLVNRFAKFTKLPPEVQEMIWNFAIEACDGTTELIEAVFDHEEQQYTACWPVCAILAVWGSLEISKSVKPIYLPSLKGADETIDSKLEPLYIRPDRDILYIPSFDTLDVQALLAQHENQVLQNLAITWRTAQSLDHITPSHGVALNWLIKGLKLKKLYILDGEYEGDEDKVNRDEDHMIELIEIRRGAAQVGSIPVLDTATPSSKWNNESFQIIERAFQAGVAEFNRKDGWTAPQIIGGEVRRTLVPTQIRNIFRSSSSGTSRSSSPSEIESPVETLASFAPFGRLGSAIPNLVSPELESPAYEDQSDGDKFRGDAYESVHGMDVDAVANGDVEINGTGGISWEVLTKKSSMVFPVTEASDVSSLAP